VRIYKRKEKERKGKKRKGKERKGKVNGSVVLELSAELIPYYPLLSQNVNITITFGQLHQ